MATAPSSRIAIADVVFERPRPERLVTPLRPLHMVAILAPVAVRVLRVADRLCRSRLVVAAIAADHPWGRRFFALALRLPGKPDHHEPAGSLADKFAGDRLGVPVHRLQRHHRRRAFPMPGP